MSTKLTTGEEANHFIEKVREKYLSKTEVFNLQDKTVTENGEVKADENYYGLNKVNVNVLPVMEPITVVSSGTEQTINPPSGTTGFSKITVNPIDLEDKTITENGVYTSETKSGFGEVTVNIKEDINLTYKQKVELLLEDFAALENFTKVPDYCFYYDTKLHYIELPDSVTEIGNFAFHNCSNLINAEFPSVTTIKGNAFYDCSNLINAEFPSVIELNNHVFYECRSLITVTLGSNLNTIAKSAFMGCTNLAEINIYAPKSQVTTAAQAPWSAPSTCQVNWLGGE